MLPPQGGEIAPWPQHEFEMVGSAPVARRDESVLGPSEPPAGRSEAAGQPRVRLAYLLVQVALRRERAMENMLAPLGLSPTQSRVLLYLSKTTDASMGQVADYIVIDRTSLTRAIDKLVAGGLVIRSEPAHDRRITCLRLTSAGQEICESVLAQFVSHSQELLRHVAEEEIGRTSDVLATMLAQLIDDPAQARRVAELF